MDKVTGYVTGVNGNLVSASFSGSVRKNEVGYVLVGDDRLKGEVIRVNGDTASMQIYEMTNGIQVGDKVELAGELHLVAHLDAVGHFIDLHAGRVAVDADDLALEPVIAHQDIAHFILSDGAGKGGCHQIPVHSGHISCHFVHFDSPVSL